MNSVEKLTAVFEGISIALMRIIEIILPIVIVIVVSGAKAAALSIAKTDVVKNKTDAFKQLTNQDKI